MTERLPKNRKERHPDTTGTPAQLQKHQTDEEKHDRRESGLSYGIHVDFLLYLVRRRASMGFVSCVFADMFPWILHVLMWAWGSDIMGLGPWARTLRHGRNEKCILKTQNLNIPIHQAHVVIFISQSFTS